MFIDPTMAQLEVVEYLTFQVERRNGKDGNERSIKRKSIEV